MPVSKAVLSYPSALFSCPDIQQPELVSANGYYAVLVDGCPIGVFFSKNGVLTIIITMFLF